MANDTLPETGFFDKHRDKITFAGTTECWLWAAGKNGGSYGWVRARGKARRAHREAYEAENGQGSADGLVVRHRCDTPACVNPAHLEIGTRADNNRDMMERGGHVACKGEANGRSKLTEADVQTILAIYDLRSPTHSLRALARRFGVNHTLISKIVRRERWRHVT